MAHRQTSQDNITRIGTRGSELALAQARELKQRLNNAHEGLEIEIVVISTSGDRIQDRPLSEIGGKGLFTQEIEEQLLDGRIDMAVHSAKDMPTILPDGLELSCFLPRENVADAFICPNHASIEDLPHGAVIGSASLRRQALIRRMRPDIKVINYRGNVQTRLRKLAAGEVDATILAQAGLNRLGLATEITSVLPVDQFPPAPGQGAICVETRTNDSKIGDLLSPINDNDTYAALLCERAFLAGLDGSCRTPIAGNAVISGDSLKFYGMILRPDGTETHDIHIDGPVVEADGIGHAAAQKLRSEAGEEFFESWN